VRGAPDDDEAGLPAWPAPLVAGLVPVDVPLAALPALPVIAALPDAPVVPVVEVLVAPVAESASEPVVESSPHAAAPVRTATLSHTFNVFMVEVVLSIT
jgi:hypothetical protein